MPRIGHGQTDISRANSTARLTTSQMSTSNQVEMSRIQNLPFEESMFADLPSKEADGGARHLQHDRRASWYEGGETLPTSKATEFQEWKNKSTSSEESWNDVRRPSLEPANTA